MVDTPFSEEEILEEDLNPDLDLDLTDDLVPDQKNKEVKELLELQERKKRLFQKKEFLKQQSQKGIERYLKERELQRMTHHFDERKILSSWESHDEERENPTHKNISEF